MLAQFQQEILTLVLAQQRSAGSCVVVTWRSLWIIMSSQSANNFHIRPTRIVSQYMGEAAGGWGSGL
jgi:hypothetical protein